MDQDAKRYGSGSGPFVALVCRPVSKGQGSRYFLTSFVSTCFPTGNNVYRVTCIRYNGFLSDTMAFPKRSLSIFSLSGVSHIILLYTLERRNAAEY